MAKQLKLSLINTSKAITIPGQYTALKMLEQKQREIENERKYAFECESCTEKYTYEDALDSEFTCPRCGALLVEAKPTKTILRLEREIAVLDKQVSEAIQKLAVKTEAKPKIKKVNTEIKVSTIF